MLSHLKQVASRKKAAKAARADERAASFLKNIVKCPCKIAQALYIIVKNSCVNFTVVV